MIRAKLQDEAFTDGIAVFYQQKNAAQPGNMPKEELVKKLALRFKRRTVGVQRNYLAKQNKERIDEVIRCPRAPGVSVNDVVILNGKEKEKYLVRQVQLTNAGSKDREGEALPTIDIALERLG